MSMEKGSETSMSNRSAGFIGAFVFIIVGGALLGISLYFQAQQRASQSWPNTPGQVTASYVEEYRDADQEVSYYARVVYAYQVQGRAYSSRQVKFGLDDSYAFQSSAANALAAYPVGKQVTVYYDPADPTNAVLDRSGDNITFFIWLGGGFLAIGLVVALRSLMVRQISA